MPYINIFKNYKSQEIVFDHTCDVDFHDNKLTVCYQGMDAAQAVLRGEKSLDHVHLLVGKTGSGKTNLLLELMGLAVPFFAGGCG